MCPGLAWGQASQPALLVGISAPDLLSTLTTSMGLPMQLCVAGSGALCSAAPSSVTPMGTLHPWAGMGDVMGAQLGAPNTCSTSRAARGHVLEGPGCFPAGTAHRVPLLPRSRRSPAGTDRNQAQFFSLPFLGVTSLTARAATQIQQGRLPRRQTGTAGTKC